MTFYVSEALAQIRQKQLDEITKQKEVESSNETRKNGSCSRDQIQKIQKKK
jgi:hypothetical protein